MANVRPPWMAYRELFWGSLIDLDKCPGVRTVRLVYIWRMLLTKCVLVVTGEEAKEACGTEQLFG